MATYEQLCKQAQAITTKRFTWVMEVINYRTGTSRMSVGAGDTLPKEGQFGNSPEARFIVASWEHR
jgi:hypothetical protein